MTTISCETILTSKHAGADKRLSTFLWTYPRWIHAEGRTHRVLSIGEDFEILPPTPSPMEDPTLSRNAASSRAIPVQKMIDAILADPAVPLFWGKNVAGMQAKEELDERERVIAYDIWMRSMESAIGWARSMCALGIDDEGNTIAAHKQIVNRMLEPYMHIKVLVSATEWTNFIGLRDHGDAEPHIQLLAQATKAELAKPAMQTLHPGEWHMPFVTRQDRQEAESRAMMVDLPHDSRNTLATNLLIKKSTACSASTSYKTVDGFEMTFDRSIALHDKLVASAPLHASPCEHVAQADEITVNMGTWATPGLHGNFSGFKQYRKMLPNESL